MKKIFPEIVGASIGGLIGGIGTGDWRLGVVAACLTVAISASIRLITHRILK